MTVAPEPASGPPDTRALVATWCDNVWNRRRDDVIDELMTPGCLVQVEGMDGELTREAFKAYRLAFLNAVPDLRVEIVAITAEGETGYLNWRARGTHLGPGLGIAPSGRAVDFGGVSMFQFQQGRIVRGFDRWNRGEMIASLMQLRMGELRQHAGLTTREAQVALLMAERYTHVEIAGFLGITPNTARRHCERVLGKLGINRRQDVAVALGKVPGSVLDRHGSDIDTAP